MRLYLTSYRIPNIPELMTLLSKEPPSVRCVLIVNGKDHKTPEDRADKVNELTGYLRDIGIGMVSELDLRTMNSNQLEQELASYNMVYVSGGNCFVLNEAAVKSGFDTAVYRWLSSDKGVYVGESAGAVVAGKSLHEIEIADDPHQAKDIIWDGFCLIDKFICPHIDSPDEVFRDVEDAALITYGGGENIIGLKDTQAAVIDGYSMKIVDKYIH